MSPFRVIALTPPADVDPSVAIAASRAGEIGLFNLEFATSERDALAGLERLARHSPHPTGVKFGSNPPGFFDAVLERLPEGIELAILTPWDPDELPRQVDRLRSRGLEILLDVTCLDHARVGERLRVDGLVAKGSESGGWVGEETCFILLQELLTRSTLPVWALGGMGLHTAAAAYAAGAAGIVLSSELALTRESAIPEPVKARIRRMDGSETLGLGPTSAPTCRVYAQPGLSALAALRERSTLLDADWRREVERCAGWGHSDDQVWLLGQDAAFAESLARRFVTVGGVLAAFREAIDEHVRAARDVCAIGEGSALAASHGTRYPIVQGPMTRVSDRAEFALSVADGGALPLLALALMRAPEVEKLLAETWPLLGERPWGVGILGFVPLELRQEQLEVIRAHRPPFALIAGGRPDQARVLEEDGVPTYLHVPSPGLLRQFLRDGARRFVFEGRECGGHIGPRSSFVLWNTILDVLDEELADGDEPNCHILFAGGVHDSLSSSMVGTMAATLAQRGVRVGVLLGTAYLFTEECVASGAIMPGFQQQAIRCERTVTLETGPGHSIRAVGTPYAEEFERERTRLLEEGKSTEEIRLCLESMNLGRLRIASKGVAREPGAGGDPREPKHLEVGEEEQYLRGMYMIGQLAGLRDRACTIEELHREVSDEGKRRLERLEPLQPSGSIRIRDDRPSQVAIVGMSCMLPKARDRHAYWENILGKVNAITEIPESRWDWRVYFDSDRVAKDKIYSKWGGFLDEEPFDPVEFGMPPNSLGSVDPMQLLSLKAARAALEDAGYLDRPFDRSRASVILGASGGTGDLGAAYLLRSSLPLLFGERAADVVTEAGDRLPEWTEDSFAGLLLNVAAGRIANRFDFGGFNYVVDAACASSLAAVHLAVKELETGGTDLVLVGGVDTTQNPFGYLCFSKTHALSPTGQARTFDASADGIAISEGIVMLVLKRLADAERDGDRIYGVIRAVSGSSDGRAKGLTAPRPEGQEMSLRRAYAKANFSPATVGLFEAHGTGTVVGDRTEALALSTVLEEEGVAPRSSAIGSVKSMIGHTKAAAGVAGLAKVALALYHKVLPPTLGVTRPNPNARFGDGPLYVNSESRPWPRAIEGHPRRAGVSSFGFGGTNFHAVVEEYTGDFLPRDAVEQRWPSELFVWSASSSAELVASLDSIAGALDAGARPELRDISHAAWVEFAGRSAGEAPGAVRLAIVAETIEDLRGKLARARDLLSRGGEGIDPSGVYVCADPLSRKGSVAFVFPGQGSQYPNMGRDLAIHFAEVREEFERADRALASHFPAGLSRHVFPPPAFGDEEERRQREELTATHVAQPALGAADIGALSLLKSFGVEPEMVAGHSYGEYVALCAAGVFDRETLATLSEARGRCFDAVAGTDAGTMAAVSASAAVVTDALESEEEVWIANVNAPEQTIISGTTRGVERAVERLREHGLSARPIPVACAFHTPVVAGAREKLATFLEQVTFETPRIKLFSNTNAAPYPDDPREVASLLAEHLVRPVQFAGEVEAMHEAGARIFVEVGPRNVLTGLIGQTLAGRPHLAIALDAPGRSGRTQLQHVLGRLAVHGVPVNLERLFRGRSVRPVRLDALEREADAARESVSPTTWLVSGGGIRRWAATEAPARASAPIALSAPADPRIDPPQAANATPGPPRADASQSLAARPMNDAAGQVLLQYQQLMNRFLETQRDVMQSYLKGTIAAPSPARATPSLQVDSPVEVPLPVAASPAVAPVESPPVDVVPTEPAPPAAPAFDRVALTEQLLQIVSERTGYPPEMLDLDVDIEAELGIDSIKRVEILGTVRRVCFPEDQAIDERGMEQLTAIKTLRGIADWLEKALQSSAGPPQVEPVQRDESPAPPPVADAPSATEVPRSKWTLVDAPLAGVAPFRVAPDTVVLVTDDERGAAAQVAQALGRDAGLAVVLRHCERSEGFERDEAGAYVANLGNPQVVERLVAAIRERHRAVSGIVHLLPLRDLPELDEMQLPDWKSATRAGTKSLFYLARAAAADLKRMGERARIVAVTPTAGAYFAGTRFHPSHAGVAGLVKSLALEWPDVTCRTVGTDPDLPPTDVRELVLGELAADGPNEIVYDGNRRRLLRPEAAPLDSALPSGIEIASDWVVLVTGGARGITAEVACEFAERFRPTLVLVGRTAFADGEESSATRGIDSPRELKAALMEEMRRVGEVVNVPAVEAAHGRLLREREIRANLARMRAAGSTVRYVRADVCDERAMTAIVAEIRAEHGRLDGVVHGAGVIEDKLVEDKTPESFDRVFDTKADSAFLLARLLDAEPPKFLVLFGSVSGSFGNRGQGDYAAANEVLNKLAFRLDRKWPGRVVSISWGPWHKAGMVSPELQREFAKRGVQLISIPDGRRAVERELRCGPKGDAEVIVAGRDEPRKIELPLLVGAQVTNGGETIEVVRVLDPARDVYLQDHRMDGKPVLPVAMALELMAEVAQRARPDLQVIGLRDLHMLKGIVLENGPKQVRVRAAPEPGNASGSRVAVEIVDPAGSGQRFYRATVELAAQIPEPPPFETSTNDGFRPFPMSVVDAYRQWLFHGKRFQGIAEIEGIADRSIAATLAGSTPDDCLDPCVGGRWLIDPVVFDSGLQLFLLWARASMDMTPLPSRFLRYRRFGQLEPERVRCHLRVREESRSPVFNIDISFVGRDGRLLGLLENMEGTCSRSLNRLGVTPTGLHSR